MEENKHTEDVIDLREVFFKYLRKWPLFVLCFLLCGMAGGYYYLRTAPKFMVSSSIMLRSEDGGMPDIGGQADMLQSLGILTGNMDAEDEINVMKSNTLMQQTVRNLDLQTSYYSKGRFRELEEYPEHTLELVAPAEFLDTLRRPLEIRLSASEEGGYDVKWSYSLMIRGKAHLEKLTDPLKTSVGTFGLRAVKPLDASKKSYRVRCEPVPVLAGALAKAVEIKPVKKESNVIQFSMATACPKKGMAILDELISLYNESAVVDKNRLAQATGEFIEERLGIITDELVEIEAQVEKYMRENNITDLSEEAKLYLENMSDYQKQTAELETQLKMLEYIREYLDKQENRYELIPNNLDVENKTLAEGVVEYNELLMRRSSLLRSSTAENPVVQQLDDHIQVARENILTTLSNTREQLLIAKADADARNDVFLARIKDIPKQEREFLEVKRQQMLKEKLYVFLSQKREENALTKASSLEPARILDAADYDWDPVSPKLLYLAAMILLGGLLLPVVLVTVHDFLFDKVADREEYERLVKAPMAGEICKTRRGRKLVVTGNATSSSAELFRLLRTNIGFMYGAAKQPVILVTSCVAGEGKSFVSSNLALALSMLKKRTVIVGLDIRNPQLHRQFDMQAGHLTEYLSGVDYKLEELIQHYSDTEESYLDVITAGPVPPNPGELLSSERLDALVEELKTQYDYIVLDTAPVGMVSDTYLLNRLSDMTLFVSRVGVTPRKACDFINMNVREEKLKNLACVLNCTNRKGHYGAYGYGGKP